MMQICSKYVQVLFSRGEENYFKNICYALIGGHNHFYTCVLMGFRNAREVNPLEAGTSLHCCVSPAFTLHTDCFSCCHLIGRYDWDIQTRALSQPKSGCG